MRSFNKKALLTFGLYLFAFEGLAGQVMPSSPPMWPDSTLSANCSIDYPTLQPLSQSRTLIVDNNLPIGTVLYSWDYGDFVPNILISCRKATSFTTTTPSIFPITANLYINKLNAGLLSGETLLSTSNSGIGLKLYFKATSKGSGNTGSPSRPESTGLGYATVGVEGSPAIMYSTTQPLSNTFYPVTDNSSAPYTLYYDHPAHHVFYSLRGELIKIGQVPESSSLQLNFNNEVLQYAFFYNGSVSIGQGFFGTEILGGGGINIVHPTCRLRGSTDYSVDLGRWVHAGPGSFQPGMSLPAYGPTQPVDLNIECSGKLNAVEFSFQDTGASPLANRNISVYDSIGGQLINGLEIEMTYGGTRLNVHKISESPTSYKTNVGAHGTIKTDAGDTSYHYQAQAQFGARFVQRSAITKGGSSYTGPVTGQVNMFVTYY